MRRLAVLALLLAFVPSRAHADDPAAAEAKKRKVEEATKKLEADKKAFEARVNTAIDRGVAWLRTQQKGDGLFPGYAESATTYNAMNWGIDALVMLTLAKSGVPVDDKQAEKLRVATISKYAFVKGQKHVCVYPAATMLLALEALYHPTAHEDTDVKRDRYGTTVTHKKTPCQY